MLTAILTSLALVQPVQIAEAVPNPAERPPAGTLADIDAAALDAMCSVNGGLAGPFGEAEITAPLLDEGTWKGPTWKLQPYVGPLVQFQRWRANTTLRYEGFTTPDFDQDSLAAHIEKVGKESEWKPFRHDNPLIQKWANRYFTKAAELNGKAVTLWLLADGGIETTSLYCSRDIEGGTNRIEQWEERAARFEQAAKDTAER
jgi:hypothetical protein